VLEQQEEKGQKIELRFALSWSISALKFAKAEIEIKRSQHDDEEIKMPLLIEHGSEPSSKCRLQYNVLLLLLQIQSWPSTSLAKLPRFLLIQVSRDHEFTCVSMIFSAILLLFFNFVFFFFVDVVVEESMHGNDSGGSTSYGKMEASLSRASLSGNHY
jgi:hypothetical protein